MKKTVFHKKSGKIADEVINGIKREYQDPPEDRIPFSLIDVVIVGLKQIDLLDEIRKTLKGKEPSND